MREIQRWIDKYIFGFICAVLGIFSKLFFFARCEKKYNKFLIIRLWAVGESILTLPMAHALKAKYPKSKITVLCTKRNLDVFYKNTDIDEIMLLKNFIKIIKSFRKFDIAVDTEPFLKISSILGFWLAKRRIGFDYGVRALLYTAKVRFNDKQHEAFTFLDLSKEISAHYPLKKLIKLNYSKEDRAKVEKFLKENKIKEKEFLVGICPGAAESSRFRMWPGERFAALSDRLIEKFGAKIIFVGSKKEKELIGGIQGMMKNTSISATALSLRELFCLIEKCRLFISNDTGPMHVAAAQGVKTIGLFGPNTPVRFAPFGKGNIAIRKYRRKPIINVHLGQVPKKSDIDFMGPIRVSDVINAVKKLK